jgi:serine protease AprX
LRWFNAVSVTANPEQLSKLNQLAFVKKVMQIESGEFVLTGIYDTILQKEDLELWENQISSLQGELFGNHDFKGSGIRIAVFDAGFPTVDVNPAFAHLQKNNRIIATWDFAKDRPEVFAYNPHGTMVLSCIAGIINNKKIGLATDAEFLLARTEIDRESFAEEENWLKAVEWADKNGADIISSSLAYTHERYYTFEMDGHTSLISKAANMAANKGMLVINSMGNDGNRDWKVMATPADADSVLSVGAISPVTGYHANFSSYGPTAKFKMKPNVVAFGQLIAANENQLEKVKGTSFSAPLITGFSACAWQVMPYLSNMQLYEKIEQSATLYPYFDYAHGYGVPQASFFLNPEVLNDVEATFQFIERDDSVFIEIDEKFIDKKFLQNNNYLYYHIENNKSYLDDYWLVDVYHKKAAAIALKEYPDGIILRAHYKGFTNSLDLTKSR